MPRKKTRHVQGIVLGHTKLSEADLIVHLLEEGGRLISCVARSARKPYSRFAARVTQFCTVDLLLGEGRNLHSIYEAELVDARSSILSDYEKTVAASALAELARLTSFEDAEDAFLFAILRAALNTLEEANTQHTCDLLVAAYTLKVLAHSGWYPQLDSCSLCMDPHPTAFSAVHGGVLCASCAKDVPDIEEITPQDIRLMQYILKARFSEISELELEGDVCVYLLARMHRFAAEHLQVRLKAYEFLLGL